MKTGLLSLQFQRMDMQPRQLRVWTIDQQWLLKSTAAPNEDYKLEYPWAWEPRVIRTLCDLVKREAPEVLFLLETRLKVHEFEVMFKLRFANCLVVDCCGRKGVLLCCGDRI